MTERVCDVCGKVHRAGRGRYFKSHEDWERFRAKQSASAKRRWADPAERAKRAGTYTLKKKQPEVGDPWMRESMATPGVTRCSRCDWSFLGPMSEGIQAAQAHRRAEHPDLPVKSPYRNRKKPKPAAPATTSEKPDPKLAPSDLRERLLGMLKAAGEPVTAKELADQLDGEVSPSSVAISLSWAKREGRAHRVGDAWALGGGEDVDDPERARIHAGILAALEGAGSEGMLAEDVGESIGVSAVSCANHLGKLRRSGRVVKASRRAPCRWALAGP